MVLSETARAQLRALRTPPPLPMEPDDLRSAWLRGLQAALERRALMVGTLIDHPRLWVLAYLAGWGEGVRRAQALRA